MRLEVFQIKNFAQTKNPPALRQEDSYKTSAVGLLQDFNRSIDFVFGLEKVFVDFDD